MTLLLAATHSSTPGHCVNPIPQFNPSPYSTNYHEYPRIRGNYLMMGVEEMKMAKYVGHGRFLFLCASLPFHLTNG